MGSEMCIRDRVDYWKPLDEIVEFKREIYEKVLTELEPAYKLEFSK